LHRSAKAETQKWEKFKILLKQTDHEILFLFRWHFIEWIASLVHKIKSLLLYYNIYSQIRHFTLFSKKCGNKTVHKVVNFEKKIIEE
jgi:hypothetical protein